jgi:hypothetical protein
MMIASPERLLRKNWSLSGNGLLTFKALFFNMASAKLRPETKAIRSPEKESIGGPAFLKTVLSEWL